MLLTVRPVFVKLHGGNDRRAPKRWFSTDERPAQVALPNVCVCRGHLTNCPMEFAKTTKVLFDERSHGNTLTLLTKPIE